jgi:hypothetical protein
MFGKRRLLEVISKSQLFEIVGVFATVQPGIAVPAK